MSFIVQRERYAIEEVTGIMPELRHGSAYALIKGNGTGESLPLYLVGVSEGFGTCSNVHGVNVLGLSKNEPKGTAHAPQLVPTCRVAVLFRAATPEEIAKNGNNRSVAAVELLEFVKIEKGTVFFRLTGHSATYVVLA
ncbi:MAG: hypothetical protein A3A33_03715 [Candidatus Yanofskybacteria bacterium RIFCSPLOWO2_01_FULL_49_25]|uniref:Uncharacterized protein n=1 Tax=Candidatus Yanofskybacteria bacterium RIFCSPLOWO2_01_FULL_49_25 TaxID=1802701 RepID=A0A1F8GXW8_9BACT|nr:MAG: hypothetical protein A3A33_03715 [Candidatus Yanofskybacteria bacterium RIFCSPLOWO2_01_FULL_49_25]